MTKNNAPVDMTQNGHGKAAAGSLYDANNDERLIAARIRCKDLCHDFNALKPSESERRRKILCRIVGRCGESVHIESQFWCDYGCNITLGENFYMNHNCVILDGAAVTFGDNVFVGPDCVFTTAGHPLDAEQRNAGLEFAQPITIKNNVWIGARALILPGVTVGENAIIAGGAVVTKDVPPNTVVGGNPARVVKEI